MNTRVRAVSTVAAVLALGVGGTALAGPAVAKPKPPKALKINYDFVGTSVVKKTGSSVPLGPTTLALKVNPDGSFTGSLPLPPAPTSFKIIGLLPVSATVTFVPAGKLTGALITTNGVSAAHSSSSYYLALSDVKTAGIPTPVGSSCRTADPVTIDLATPAGQAFGLGTGGTLTGTYTIGNFANCGLTTGLLNLLIPGPDNTATVQLSNGQVQN